MHPDSVRRLPQRLLYAGEFISIQLVGLLPNRSLSGYQAPQKMLLMVAFGQVRLRTHKSEVSMQEAESMELDPACIYEISTDEIADLLLITLPSTRKRIGAFHSCPTQHHYV